MAKNQKKSAPTSSATPVKSKKPRMPGINHIPDFPKGFRTHSNRAMLKGLVGQPKRSGYITPGLAGKSKTEEN